MIIVKTKDTACSICSLHIYPGYRTWFFWKEDEVFRLFQNEPYYFCTYRCYALFQLTPLLATPVKYTLRYDFKGESRTKEETEEANKLGFDLTWLGRDTY